MQDTTRTTTRDDSNVWKGFAAGLVGGLVASWTMNRFQDLWREVAEGVETSPGNQFHKVSGAHAEGGEETSGTQDLELGSNLLNLSAGPMAYPLSIHAYALSSHFIYGVTAEEVRRGVRGAL